MGKSEHRKILIDFFNWYNDNPKEFSNNETIVDAYIDSHSPTETEFNTLQEGDWCKFDNESQARENSKHWVIASDFLEHAIKDSMQRGVQFVNGTIYLCHDKDCKTQLTPEEFLRRADNTFKTK